MDYGALPPEINSGRMYTGPGSGSLMASAAAWNGLCAELGSAATAFSAVVTTLTAGPWLGPSSVTMVASAAPYVVWMMATAAQCQAAADAAEEAASAFEAAHAAVVPPPEIEENRIRLATLIATNFMGINTPAIAATEADYDRMWAQDATTMYGMAGDFAGATGTLVPFTPPIPNTNPGGMAMQAAAVGQSAGLGVGQQSEKVAGAVGQLGAMPGGFDAQTMLSMGPQLIGTFPQMLQGLASPLSSGMNPSALMGPIQSMFGPLLSGMGNPGSMFGGAGAASSLGSIGNVAMPGLSGLSGGASATGSSVGAVAGGASSVGGVSVPTAWTAGASESASTAATATPLAAAAGTSTAAAPAAASGTGSGMYGGAPLAALGSRSNSSSEGQRYGTPVRITPKR
jgi:PPE-repeat protein